MPNSSFPVSLSAKLLRRDSAGGSVPGRKRRLRFAVAAVLALGSFLLLPPAAADWPTYQGDASRSGAAVSELELPLRAAWTSEAPAVPRLAWSSGEGRVLGGKLLGHRVRFDDAFRTTVSEGRVYFGSTVDHRVHCLDLASGETLWTFFTGGPVRLAPTVHEGTVLFGSDDGRVYCLDKETGDLRWERRVAPLDEWLLARGEMISKWPVRTGVLVHRGIAYYGAGIFPHENVYLEGADAATGEPVWRADNLSEQDAGRDDLSPQGYLLAKDDLLVVPSGRSLPAVFDLSSGELLHKRNHSWRTTAGGVVGGARALLADGQLYASGPHHFLAMDERSGDTGFAWVEGRQLVIDGDEAFIATGERLARLDRIAYAENSRERQRLEMEIYSAGRARSGADAEKRAELEASVAEANARLEEIAGIGILWEVPTGADLSLLATPEHLVLGGPEGVAIYRREDGEKVWETEVEGEPRGLAVAGGRLLVSTDLGVITCFAPGEAGPAEAVATRWRQGGDPAENAVEPSAESDTAAREIIEGSGVARGYALVLGSGDGDLAIALARHSELKIYCVESDPEKLQRSRERLAEAGLYGHRVAVHAWEGPEVIPYSNYFANLVVSEDLAPSGVLPAGIEALARHVKPYGGVFFLGGGAEPSPESEAALASLAASPEAEFETIAGKGAGEGVPAALVRSSLPGAGDWSHQYGSPDNTAISRDTRVKGDLGVLWYGDPGPDQMVNRHEGAVGPLSANGLLFVQGEWSIMAYDAYNGVHLWTHENPEAIRTGVFQNQNPGNLAVGAQSLFHFHGGLCYEHDQATGELVATHQLPPGLREGEHEWGYLAIHDGVLYGTATVRREIEERQRRRGRATEESTDAIFAIDLESREPLWTYQGQSISHHTIAIGDDKVCFIDSSITSEQREEVLRQDKGRLASLEGEERELAEARAKEADLRMAVALDARSGEPLWSNPVDVTDCSDIGIGGGRLTMMYADGKLVLCGANANGHYWRQFMDGEFQRRRIVVLSAENGYQLWGKDANYLHRPVVIGGQILAEPWMYDLETGEQITRSHPVTGAEEPWSMMRTGHHCGMVTGSDSGMLLFRSGSTAFSDLYSDEGIRHFSGHRTGCWINAIVAGGLVMVPEASAGCVCQFSLASTIVLEPRERRRPWTVFSAVGELLPVRHLAVNLGAPGDRRDEAGTMWLSYPRYKPYRQTSLEVPLELSPRFAASDAAPRLARSSSLFSGGINASGFRNVSEESALPATAVETAGEAEPWLYHSWAEGLAGLAVPLTEDGETPAAYTLRLHFAPPAEGGAASAGALRLGSEGGETRELVLPAVAEGQHPQVLEVTGLQVSGTLEIEFAGEEGVRLSALEAVRE